MNWKPFEERVPNGRTPDFVEGIVTFSRGESSDCICCEGQHIFGIDIAVPPFAVPYAGLEGTSVFDYVSGWLSSRKREGIEGRRVRVTIELIDAEQPPAPTTGATGGE